MEADLSAPKDARPRAAEIKRLRAAQAWRPIETAPRDGQDVLLAIPMSRTPVIGYWRASGCWSVAWDATPLDGEPFETPTHWQPLPEPPPE